MVAGVSGKSVNDLIGPEAAANNPVATRTHDPEANRELNETALKPEEFTDVSNAVPKFTEITSLEAVKTLKTQDGQEVDKATQRRIRKVLTAVGLGSELDRDKGEFIYAHVAVTNRPTEDDPKNVEVKLTVDFGKNFEKSMDKHGFFSAVFGWIPNMWRTVNSRTMTKFSKSAYMPQDPDAEDISVRPGLPHFREGVDEGRYTSSVLWDLSTNSKTKNQPVAIQIFDNMRAQLEQMEKLAESFGGDDNPLAQQIKQRVDDAKAKDLHHYIIAGTTYLNPNVKDDFLGTGNHQLARRQELQATFAETMPSDVTVIAPHHTFAGDFVQTRDHVYETVNLTSVEILDGELQEHTAPASIIRNKDTASKELPARDLAEFVAGHTLFDIANSPSDLTEDMQTKLMDTVQRNTKTFEHLNGLLQPNKPAEEQASAAPSPREEKSSVAMTT